MHAGVVGELFELGSAGEAVREDHGAYSCSADGGQQRGLRDRHRDVVVAAFDTKITSQTAATADGADLGPCSGEQRGVGFPAQHRVLVTVWLRNSGDPLE